ncbi:NMA1 [Symbiodinium microadriaticum]|nr:NMA1 [Symbiodinium sp. KB8]CAE7666335.1 NMA1 [Symbiodinium microadriaticum]
MSMLGKAAQERRPFTAGLLHDWVNVAALTAIFALSAAALESGEESSLHTIVIAVTAAYLVSDALWIALQPDMVKTPVSVILHHLVTLIVIVEPMFYESHRVNASRALLVEINTVLLTLRRLLGRPAWCELGFYLTWAVIRLIWFPALGTALLASTFGWTSPLAALPPPLTALVVEVRPPAIRSYASLSFAAVVLLQFYWTCAMGRGMCKSGANRESRKERSLESEPSAPANFRYLALSLLSTGLIAGSLLYWMLPGTLSEGQTTIQHWQRWLVRVLGRSRQLTPRPVLMAAAFAAARGLTRAISRCAKKRVPERALFSRLSAPAPPALAALPGVRAFSRTSWESGDDVDLDSVAYGFMASQALFSALELGIFDKVAAAGEKGCAAKDVQQACGVEGPRLTTLLTALTAVKCLRRSDEGLYTLSPNTAQYMVSSSRHYYGDYLQYQIGRQFYHRMGALPEVMTTGKAPSYASWFSDPEVAKTYTQTMAGQLEMCMCPLEFVRNGLVALLSDGTEQARAMELELQKSSYRSCGYDHDGRLCHALPQPPPAAEFDCDRNDRAFCGFSRQSCKLPLSKLKLTVEDGRIPVAIVAPGSFSPPTLLHLRMFEEARDALERAASGRFAVVGGYLSPVHDSYGKVTLAPSHHRLKMVEAAVSDSDWLMADGWECTCQSTWTPTVDVISHFAAELAKVKVSVGNSRKPAGNIRLVMLCGGDVLESFNATKENGDRVWPDDELEVILGQHGVVVVGRDDQDLDAFVQQCPLLARYADNITIAQPRIRTGISSSAVRAHLAAGESIRYLVHDKVWRYIFRHRLNAQHNGSVATAKYLVRKKLDLGGISSMLDVGGGSGAFSYVFTEATPGLKSTVLELPEVCRTGEGIKAQQPQDIQDRVSFVELDATSPDWPVSDSNYDIVLMSYISGSVPESVILPLYKNAFKTNANNANHTRAGRRIGPLVQ